MYVDMFERGETVHWSLSIFIYLFRLGRTLSFVCRLAGGLFFFCLFFCLFFLFNSFCFLLAGPNRQSCGF